MYASTRASELGYTLVELLAVITIVAVLAALVYPSYADKLRHARRADAQSALLEAAQFMQAWYGMNNRYDMDLAGVSVTQLPSYLQHAPRQGALMYDIGFVAADDLRSTSFKLTATPRGLMADDACGALSIDHTGLKGNASSQPSASCWP